LAALVDPVGRAVAKGGAVQVLFLFSGQLLLTMPTCI